VAGSPGRCSLPPTPPQVSPELSKTARTWPNGDLGPIMRFLIIASLAFTSTLAVSLPATALTCEVVRALSKTEQDYWSQRLALTSAQRHQIWLQCYRKPPAQRVAAPLS
jgi:hypothetical protein